MMEEHSGSGNRRCGRPEEEPSGGGGGGQAGGRPGTARSFYFL